MSQLPPLPEPNGWIFDGSPDGLRFTREPLNDIAMLVHSSAPVFTADQMRAYAGQARADLLADAMHKSEAIQKLWKERDELRRALEIIAVGDAENPQAQAAEELIALGIWRDIPEARTIAAMKGQA